MQQLYKNPAEEAGHLEEMKTIALHTGKELKEVTQVYEAVLTVLLAEAHVRDFLVLLTGRRTREALGAQAVPLRATGDTASRHRRQIAH